MGSMQTLVVSVVGAAGAERVVMWSQYQWWY